MLKRIQIELTENEAKGLVLNEGLSFFWKNKIDKARWDAVLASDKERNERNVVTLNINTLIEAQDLILQAHNIPNWFFVRVCNEVFCAVKFKV
jgi:hypothetical protein